MTTHHLHRRNLFLFFAGYLIFVVYGSLVPFHYRHHTLAQALEQFAAIGYLNLGMGSRADWIANIVLYVPLAFSGCAWLAGMAEPRRGAPLRVGLVVLWCVLVAVAVAVAVEFTQIFFSPRTVSLNDLLAESIGIALGTALWAGGRRRIAALWEAFAHGGRASVWATAAAFAAAYLVLSLFPYDVIVSAQEWHWKMQAGRHAWLLVPGNSLLRSGARLAADALAVAPVGVLLALGNPRWTLPRAFLLGAGVGLALELAQLFLVSGTSQGASVLLRGAGLAAGVAVGRFLLRRGPALLAQRVWQLAPFAALPYAAAVLALSGWFSRSWLPLPAAAQRLAEVRFLPFYYHYFSTESAAMASLLAIVALYAPLGLAVWAWQMMSGRDSRRGAVATGCCAVLLTAVVELGKLAVPPKHPDPTNLLIAAAGAICVRALAAWCARVLDATSIVSLGNRSDHNRQGGAADSRRAPRPADS